MLKTNDSRGLPELDQILIRVLSILLHQAFGMNIESSENLSSFRKNLKKTFQNYIPSAVPLSVLVRF